MESPLKGCKALVCDVFGTCVDCETSLVHNLRELFTSQDFDWKPFVQAWLTAYDDRTGEIATGSPGSTNVDELNRQNLDAMLASPEWSHVSASFRWSDGVRDEAVQLWHRFRAWSDSSTGLHALKMQGFIVATLSNGTVRLLINLAKLNDLPWDTIFGGDLFNTYKPNAHMFLGAARLLGLPPHEVVMVAAHIDDLRAAASYGLRTVYVRRLTEDVDVRETVKSKADGGEVDIVVDSLEELAQKLR